MKKELYYKKNTKNRLWFLLAAILVTLIEVQNIWLKIASVILVFALGYKFLLPKDFRIAYDEQFIYLDNIIQSKSIPFTEIIKIEPNRWNFTSSATGGPSEFGYVIHYHQKGKIKTDNFLVDSSFFEEWEKFIKNNPFAITVQNI